MIKVELECGFTAEIDEDVLDDAEIFEQMVAVDQQRMTALPGLIKAILGEEKKKELYEFLREDGRVRLTSVVTALFEIVNALNGKK